MKSMIEFVMEYRIFSYQDPRIENFLSFSERSRLNEMKLQSSFSNFHQLVTVVSLQTFFKINLKSAKKFDSFNLRAFISNPSFSNEIIFWQSFWKQWHISHYKQIYEIPGWNKIKKIRVFSTRQKNFLKYEMNSSSFYWFLVVKIISL